MLHELIHHVHRRTGTADTWPCPSHGKEKAYTLGGRFLRETGTPGPIPNRAFRACAYAVC